ncbi:hypothetical protein D3C85_1619690 [compost metagenome]
MQPFVGSILFYFYINVNGIIPVRTVDLHNQVIRTKVEISLFLKLSINPNTFFLNNLKNKWVTFFQQRLFCSFTDIGIQ